MKFSECRDASNRLTVAIDGISSMTYRFVRWRLCSQFGLKRTSEYVKGLDEKFQSFSNSKGKVSIDWDVWSGFMVTALDTESEQLVNEVGSWLKHKYAK